MANAREGLRILMVEDTIEYAQLNLMVLRRQGFDVYHAKDGEEAIRYIDQAKPDVILLDLNLPYMSGWDVLNYYNQRYGEGTTCVIVTSAYSDSANRIVGKLQDVFRYLIKPFTPQDLIRTVEMALGFQTP